MSAARFSLMSIVGARPQFVKAAAVSRAIAARTGDRRSRSCTPASTSTPTCRTCSSTSSAFPGPSAISASHGGNHGDMTGRMLAALEAAMLDEQPDRRAGLRRHQLDAGRRAGGGEAAHPGGHVEAGLRSYNRRMPEEINRVLTDHVSRPAALPDRRQRCGTCARKASPRACVHVGDVMYDVDAVRAIERAKTQSHIVETLGLKAGGFALCTVHRAENTDDPAAAGSARSRFLADAERGSAHRASGASAHAAGHRHARAGHAAGLKLIEPLGYLDMTRCLRQCSGVYHRFGRPAEGGLFPPQALRHAARRDRMGRDRRGRLEQTLDATQLCNAAPGHPRLWRGRRRRAHGTRNFGVLPVARVSRPRSAAGC